MICKIKHGQDFQGCLDYITGMYDKDKQSTEFGIAPDYNVGLNDTDAARGIDSIIEFARKLAVQ